MIKLTKNKKMYRVVAAAMAVSIMAGVVVVNNINSSADKVKENAVDRLIAKRDEVYNSQNNEYYNYCRDFFHILFLHFL